MKVESKRVEALMKKLAAQQVQQEKDEGHKRLEEALAKAREEFKLEMAEAVQQTREEEIVIAADKAKKVAQAEEDKRKQLILAAEKEKQVTELLLFVNSNNKLCCMVINKLERTSKCQHYNRVYIV